MELLEPLEQPVRALRTFVKNAAIDYQWLTKKVMFYNKKYAKIFGQSKKKQYLCSRFRAQRKRAVKWREWRWKM